MPINADAQLPVKGHHLASRLPRFTAIQSGGEHLISNGLLLRSDLHRLFDRGYITVNANDLTIVVSPRIKQEYENGRAYYLLHGQRLAQPIL